MKQTGTGPFNAQLRRRQFGRGGAVAIAPEDPIPFLDPGSPRQNPTGYARGYRGGGDALTNDERAIGATRAALARGVANLNDAIEAQSTYNPPPKLKYVPFLAYITAAAKPALLLPFNRRRVGFIVSNFRIVPASGITGVNGILFSFGAPLQTALGELAGVPLSPCYQETNGTIACDAIYVFCNDSTQDFTAPGIPVCGFEANLALGAMRE